MLFNPKGVEEREIIGDSALHVRIEWLSECIEHDSLVSCDTFKVVIAFFTNDTNCNDKRTRDERSHRGVKCDA